jgi:predicted acylesterase/phospholipase RssA
MHRQNSKAPLKNYHAKAPKRVLVLSGGAFYGAFELGVISYLIEELNMEFDIVCGTSVGALNAAMVVRGNIGEAEDIWRSIDSRDDIFRPGILGNVIAKGGLYGIEPLAELIDKHVDVERLRKSETRLLVGVVCLETGEFLLIDQNSPNIKSYILASASVPGMTPAIKIDGKHYVDGGLRYVMPVKQIMDLDVEEIIMVSAFSLEDKVAPVESKNLKRFAAGDYGKITHFTERAVQIVMHQLLREPIDYALRLAPHKGIDIKLIQPDQGVYKKGAFEFDREEIHKAIEHGYEQARKAFPIGQDQSNMAYRK